MRDYIDSCLTLDILKQDSGLLPKPTETWNTFEPKVGDLAYVNEDNSEYEFNGIEWIKKEIPSWEEERQAELQRLKEHINNTSTLSLRNNRTDKQSSGE